MALVAGLHYSLEPRLRGTNLTQILAEATGNERECLLQSYMQAAANVRHLTLSADYTDAYGEVLVEQPVRASQWHDFLERRAMASLVHSRKYLSDDVPNLEAVIQYWQDAVRSLPEASKQLVHGDFFPGNVMAERGVGITAVIDFSPMTVIGDWQLDLAGAVIFLEVTTAYQNEDSAIAKRIADEQLGADSAGLLELYRLYYSLYFSAAKEDDPDLYAWCVQNLRRAAERLKI